jgi:indolepyruvate ferredoxin oxidoreductase alpha subunit
LANAALESESCSYTVEEMRETSLGIVCSGVVYQYVREALPDASTLRIGMSFPLPEDRIRAFASKVDRLDAVEELDPYLRSSLAAMGLTVDPVPVPHVGELSTGKVAAAFGAAPPETREPMDDLPARPPMLCAGCPHRGVFVALRAMGAVVQGDIGCYALAAAPPLSAMDSCVDMGASIGMAHGMSVANASEGDGGRPPVVAVIGDSTFAHSGLTGLLNSVYNNGDETIVILDNRTTAMTGHQDNPFTGRTLMGDAAPDIDIEAVVRALGVASVVTVNPNLLKPTARALAEAVASPGVSVVIARAPCVLLKTETADPFAVEKEKCDACGECVRLGCPAISRDDAGGAVIDAPQCVGCRQCVQVCRCGAIVRVGRACDVRSGL